MGSRSQLIPVLVAPDRVTKIHLPAREGLSFNGGVQGEGDLSITFDPVANDLPRDALSDIVANDGHDWGVQIWQDPSNPSLLWDGVVARHDTRFAAGSVRVDLRCEALVRHIARRRLGLEASNASVVSTATDATTTVGVIASTAFSGSPPTMSPIYPRPSRSDFGPWTASVGTLEASRNAYFGVESSGNLWDLWVELAILGDIRIELAETSPGVFVYNFRYPYVDTDRTTGADKFLLDDLGGHIAGLTRSVDLTEIANVFQVLGEGAKTAQAYGWATLVDSCDRYGIYEGADSRPAVPASAMDVTANAIAQQVIDYRTGYPHLTWSVELIPNDERVFGLDYRRSDKVAVYHSGLDILAGLAPDLPPDWPEPGQPIEATVIGYSCQEQDGVARFTLTIGDRPRNFVGEILNKIGSPDGRYIGGAYSMKRGV